MIHHSQHVVKADDKCCHVGNAGNLEPSLSGNSLQNLLSFLRINELVFLRCICVLKIVLKERCLLQTTLTPPCNCYCYSSTLKSRSHNYFLCLNGSLLCGKGISGRNIQTLMQKYQYANVQILY